MAEDVKAEELIETLRQSFEARIRAALSWLPAHEALQLADALCGQQLETLAGMRVTYKAAREVDAAAITEDWRRGLLIGEIVAKHRVSRPTAYKYHPNKSAGRRARG